MNPNYCTFVFLVVKFLFNEVYANKLILYSELIIFIRYKNNGYFFICHTEGNVIFHSTHAIFNKKFFPKYIDFYNTKKHKLYDKLLNKTSSETELSVSGPLDKDGPAPLYIIYTPISSI